MKESEEIREKSQRYGEETAELLSELVKIPSLSGEEGPLIERLAGKLEDYGFDEVKTDGLGNLIGRIGSGPKTLAVDAHIDTVDVGDRRQWQDDPYSGAVRNGWVLGRGAVDQKGGAASMVTAGRILKELAYDGPLSIFFTFTIMEEDCDGLCWKYLIEEQKLVPDFVLITEPTSLGLYRGHRGRMEVDIFFKGLSAHGSAPERGDNAVYKAARTALKIADSNAELKEDSFLGKGSVAVTRISSESPSLCAIPDSAGIHLDRRLTWGESKESVLNELAGILGDVPAEIRVPVYDRPSYKGTRFSQEMVFPTWKISEEHPLIKAGETAHRLLFQAPAKTGKWTFSTNGVATCGRAGIPTIGFGPGDEVFAHAPNERIRISHLVKASAFYAMLPFVLGERD